MAMLTFPEQTTDLIAWRLFQDVSHFLVAQDVNHQWLRAIVLRLLPGGEQTSFR
jgi:hypothetical protein